jgi:hypothetical protein
MGVDFMSEETPKDPAQDLAERIVDKLTADGLILENKSAEVLAKLKAGTAKAEDWGLWTELAKEADPGDDGDDQTEYEA